MSGKPDWKPERREKRARRARDPLAVKNATLSDRECWVCGRDGANGHHLIPKDFTKPGPDEDWNIISLCGTGTSGCHGAFHGNPYSHPLCAGAEGKLGQYTRITPTLARARIAARLLRDRPRLREVWDFLSASELQERFFVRVLSMKPRDVDDLRRRVL